MRVTNAARGRANKEVEGVDAGGQGLGLAAHTSHGRPLPHGVAVDDRRKADHGACCCRQERIAGETGQNGARRRTRER